jgi:hypothetical protein
LKLLSRVAVAGLLALAVMLFSCSVSLGVESYTWNWSNGVPFGLTAESTKISFDDDILLGDFTFVDGSVITFTSLLLDSHVDSVTLGTASANMTVTYLSSTRITYDVTGAGSQTMNFGLAPVSVTADGVPQIAGAGYSYDSETQDLTVSSASEDAVVVFFSGSDPAGSIDTSYSDPLFQYVLENNLLGFVLACYTSTVGSVFYAICIFFVSAVIYIRQRSLFVVSLIWLLVGGSFVVLFWAFSPVAVWFTLLGICGVVAEIILAWRRGH